MPAEIPPALVAPLFCAGLTVFSPLKRGNVGPGTRVGVVGVGGLGHYAIMFAVALGAEVTAISHSQGKKDDAFKMGAKHFIVTGQDGWAVKASRSLDMILSTTNAKDMPLEQYLGLLDVGGTFVYVGIPEANMPELPYPLMIGNNSAIRGSNTGSRKEVLEMLELVKVKGIKSWVEEFPMSQASDVLKKQMNGESRYRFVLKSDGGLSH